MVVIRNEKLYPSNGCTDLRIRLNYRRVFGAVAVFVVGMAAFAYGVEFMYGYESAVERLQRSGVSETLAEHGTFDTVKAVFLSAHDNAMGAFK